jgi:hypothetical protein
VGALLTVLLLVLRYLRVILLALLLLLLVLLLLPVECPDMALLQTHLACGSLAWTPDAVLEGCSASGGGCDASAVVEHRWWQAVLSARCCAVSCLLQHWRCSAACI